MIIRVLPFTCISLSVAREGQNVSPRMSSHLSEARAFTSSEQVKSRGLNYLAKSSKQAHQGSSSAYCTQYPILDHIRYRMSHWYERGRMIWQSRGSDWENLVSLLVALRRDKARDCYLSAVLVQHSPGLIWHPQKALPPGSRLRYSVWCGKQFLSCRKRQDQLGAWKGSFTCHVKRVESDPYTDPTLS